MLPRIVSPHFGQVYSAKCHRRPSYSAQIAWVCAVASKVSRARQWQRRPNGISTSSKYVAENMDVVADRISDLQSVLLDDGDLYQYAAWVSLEIDSVNVVNRVAATNHVRAQVPIRSAKQRAVVTAYRRTPAAVANLCKRCAENIGSVDSVAATWTAAEVCNAADGEVGNAGTIIAGKTAAIAAWVVLLELTRHTSPR